MARKDFIDIFHCFKKLYEEGGKLVLSAILRSDRSNSGTQVDSEFKSRILSVVLLSPAWDRQSVLNHCARMEESAPAAADMFNGSAFPFLTAAIPVLQS